MLHAFSLYGLCGIFNICDFGICSSVAHISFPRLLVLSTVNTMGALIMRMSYRYAYKCSDLETFQVKF